MTGPGGAFKLRGWEAEAEAGEVSEFKASLVYGLQSSRTAKAVHRETQSRKPEVGHDRKRKGRKDVIEGTEVAGS